MEENLTPMGSLDIVLITDKKGNIFDLQTLKRIEDFSSEILSINEVGVVVSINDYLKEINQNSELRVQK